MNLKTLEQYVPIVDRVHGAVIEFHDVRKVFEEINLKLKNTEEDIPTWMTNLKVKEDNK